MGAALRTDPAFADTLNTKFGDKLKAEPVKSAKEAVTTVRNVKPAAVTILAENIPPEMKQLDQWVSWSWNWNGKKWDKPPMLTNGKGGASVTSREDWVSFDTAYKAYSRGRFDGIGFVFTEDSGFVGVDLDNHYDSTTATLTAFGQTIVNGLDTYTEVSPSGTGIKVFCRGSRPNMPKANHAAGVECYSTGRYFTMTGNHLAGTPAKCEERTAAMARILPPAFEKPRRPTKSQAAGGLPTDDRAVALEALTHLSQSRADGYWDWLGVGMALYSVDSSDSMLQAWEAWSRCSTKYTEGVCADKWASFGAAGYTIASLFFWAKEDGWEGPKRQGDARKGKSRIVDLSSTDDDDPLDLAKPEGRTDLANARRLVRWHGEDLRFCHPWGKWLGFDGERWKPDAEAMATNKAAGVSDRLWGEAREIANEAPEALAPLLTFAGKSASCQSIANMLKLATAEPSVPVMPGELDCDPFLLNCVNGTVDLRTGTLRPASRHDLLTKLCPTVFDPRAECPTWHAFLHGIFGGDHELIAFVWQLAGYSISGDVREQLLAVLCGSGSNGKSLFIKTLMNVLGTDYSMQAASDMLMLKHQREHPTALADLFGKRFIAAIETGDGQSLDEVLIKQLTGSDAVRCRRLYEDHWEFQPSHKIWLTTNHKPSVRGTDHAIWRRIKLVPFGVTFWDADKGETGPAELRQDKALAGKLAAEAPGILRWCVDGCRDWLTHGLRTPESVLLATAEYRAEEDVVSQFIEDRCLTDASNHGLAVRAQPLFEAYERWAGPGRRMSLTKFGKRLTALGYRKERSNGIWYQGIALRPEYGAEQ